MKKRQILWAFVFGSMLAITGCGDDETTNGGSGGTGGTGGTGGSGGMNGTGGGSGGGDATAICEALCADCSTSGVDCKADCEEGLGGGADFNDCPSELADMASCLEGSGCTGIVLDCSTEWLAWIQCAINIQF